MKRYISAFLACLLVFSLASCGKADEQTAAAESTVQAEKESGTAQAETAVPYIPETETAVPPATQKTDTKNYKKEYASYLREVIDSAVNEKRVYAAAVFDADGDGIPAVILSLDPSPQHVADVIINYKDGKFYASRNVASHPEGTGHTVSSKTLYVEGTDYIIFRALGTCEETAAYNEFDLYAPEDGGYVKTMHYSHNCSEAAKDPDFAGNWGFAAYQATVIIPGFETRVREETGIMANIIDCTELFTVFDEEKDINKQAEKWLEKQLGINI